MNLEYLFVLETMHCVPLEDPALRMATTSRGGSDDERADNVLEELASCDNDSALSNKGDPEVRAECPM
jgi:hypothetical protein